MLHALKGNRQAPWVIRCSASFASLLRSQIKKPIQSSTSFRAFLFACRHVGALVVTHSFLPPPNPLFGCSYRRALKMGGSTLFRVWRPLRIVGDPATPLTLRGQSAVCLSAPHPFAPRAPPHGRSGGACTLSAKATFGRVLPTVAIKLRFAPLLPS